MKTVKRAKWSPAVASAWFVVMVATTCLAESPEPRGIVPVVCDASVSVEYESGDVSVIWSDGTPPPVVRIDADELSRASTVEVVLLKSTSRHVIDRGAFDATRRYYYQVYDANSPPHICYFSPDGGLPGTEICVKGVSFPSNCDELQIHLAGVEATEINDCNFTGFVYRVPEGTITGYLARVAHRSLPGVTTSLGSPRRSIAMAYRAKRYLGRPTYWPHN